MSRAPCRDAYLASRKYVCKTAPVHHWKMRIRGRCRRRNATARGMLGNQYQSTPSRTGTLSGYVISLRRAPTRRRDRFRNRIRAIRVEIVDEDRCARAR